MNRRDAAAVVLALAIAIPPFIASAQPAANLCGFAAKATTRTIPIEDWGARGAARAIGLAIPPNVLLRADEVIE